MTKLTEARIAIGISAFALMITFWQGYESHIANAGKRELLMIEVTRDGFPSLQTGQVNCVEESVGFIQLNWRVNIYNLSTQPTTIKDLTLYTLEDETLWGGDGRIRNDDNINLRLPLTIDARDFLSFRVSSPAYLTGPFYSWLRNKGFCEGGVDWEEVESQIRYKTDNPVNTPKLKLTIILTTSDGNIFDEISNYSYFQ